MVTSTDVLTKDKLQRFVEKRARVYAIPSDKVEITIYRDSNRQKDVIRANFQPHSSMKKYQAELSCNLTTKTNKQITDTITRRIDDLIESLEYSWFQDGENITFYSNHAFFYVFNEIGGKAHLEVRCTVCNHIETTSSDSVDVLDKYRDIFLMNLLPKVHAKCDCAAGKYDSVQRPALHDLTR